jgi:hypothetical protein
MRSIVNAFSKSSAQLDLRPVLTLPQGVEPSQLDSMKAQLDLVLLALEALAMISSDDILSAAAELNLNTLIADRVTLWRLRQANPLRNSQGGRKKLDVDEARSLVLICCRLAQKNQDLIYRAVALLEELTARHRQPYEAALLGDYLDRFCNYYQERMESDDNTSPDHLTQLALKLLLDLLFYSSPSGSRHFWLALLDRSTQSIAP